MKLYSTLLLGFYLMLSVSMEAQQLMPSQKTDPKDGKRRWGYADRFFTAYAITPAYDSTFVFAEGAGRFIQNGKYGFLDKNGTVIIPAKYEMANDFSQGLAAVKMGGKTLYIDKKGTDVFKKTFINGFDFSDGLAMVADEAGLLGFINKTGTLVIPYEFKSARPFSKGLAPVVSAGQTTWKTIDAKGKTVFTFSDQVNYARSGFDEGLASVYRRDGTDENSHFDFVNEKGDYICQAPYLDTNPFKNGRAVIMKTNSGRAELNAQNYKYGLINRYGKEVVPATYACLEESAIRGIYFYGVPAGTGYGCSGYGLMDSMGKVITPATFSSFTRLNDTTFLCKETDRASNQRFLLLTTSGKELLSVRQYNKEFSIVGTDTLLMLFSDFGASLSMSLYNTRSGVMVDNSSGGIIIYEKLKLAVAFSSTIADGSILTTSGKILADKVNMQIIYENNATKEYSPFILLKKNTEPSYRLFNLNTGKYMPLSFDFGSRPYEYNAEFNAGLLAVKQKDKWGFMDSTGKVKIPLIYEKAGDFYSGWAVVQKKSSGGGNMSMAYINTSGKEMPGIKADFLNASDFSEGIAYFSPYEEYGKEADLSVCYINKSGKIIYRSAGDDYYKHGRFSNGMAAVSDKEGLFGFINNKGELVIPCQYSIPARSKDDDDEDDDGGDGLYVGYLEFDKYGHAEVEKDGEKFKIDKTGKRIQ